MTEQELFAFFGKVLAWIIALIISSTCAAAGAVWLLIKFGVKKWIENKLSKDLEAFKVQELHKFDWLLTKKTKWHQVEYEVLSTSWKKLKAAHNALKQSISLFKHVPLLDRMDESELKNFIERRDLTDSEKDYLSKEKNKTTAYEKILDHRDLAAAYKAFIEFHTYFEDNSIFLSPDVKQKFSEVDNYILEIWISKKMSLGEYKDSYDYEIKAFDVENEKIKPLIDNIEELLQKKLFPEEMQKVQ